jgi:hypothetical protein
MEEHQIINMFHISLVLLETSSQIESTCLRADCTFIWLKVRRASLVQHMTINTNKPIHLTTYIVAEIGLSGAWGLPALPCG